MLLDFPLHATSGFPDLNSLSQFEKCFSQEVAEDGHGHCYRRETCVCLAELTEDRGRLVDLLKLINGLKNCQVSRRLTVLAIKAASSPCEVYQSPLSKIRMVSSSLTGKSRKKRINPISSST